AIDLAGRGMDETLDAEVARSGQEVERSFDVGVEVGLRCDIGEGNRDQRREVQHGIATVDGAAHAIAVANVAGNDFDLAAGGGRDAVQPSPGVERIIHGEGAHFGARVEELFDEMRADKTVGTGDKNLHHKKTAAYCAGRDAASSTPPAKFGSRRSSSGGAARRPQFR